MKANHLSTLSLQYDKRMEDELRGAKRKIKLVQEQVSGVLNNTQLDSVKTSFLTVESWG